MNKRTHKPTSKAGENFIASFKPSHKSKILEGLEKLKVGGTQEEIAKTTGLREDQVWKRLSELQTDGKIFDTGITRKLKSGLQGIVWQLEGQTVKEGDVPVIEKPKKKQHFIAETNQQKPLFT